MQQRYRISAKRHWWRWFSIGFAGGLLLFVLLYRPSSPAVTIVDRSIVSSAEEQKQQAKQALPAKQARQPLIQLEWQERSEQELAEELAQQVEEATQQESMLTPNQSQEEPVVAVYLQAESRLEKVPLEDYVLGVVAGEMPAEFELEALKAQAIAARTFVVRRLWQGRGTDEQLLKRGADVTDTTQHQVYISRDKLASYWPASQQEEYSEKLRQAVEETSGQVITYNGEPIEASYFSTSNGYTEAAVDYWGQDYPYLQSVVSSWDKQTSPRFEDEKVISIEQMYQQLGLTGKQASKKPKLKVTARTTGKRVKTIDINNVSFSGKEVREKLELRSSHFDWKVNKDEIVFSTFGYGHGVGMSQWGANGMAKEGYQAAEIIAYYYKGVTIEQVSKFVKNNSY